MNLNNQQAISTYSFNFLELIGDIFTVTLVSGALTMAI